MEDVAGFLPLILIAAAFWFLVLRPAQKRSREARETQMAAQVGSEVMLTSGIYGIVTDIEDNVLRLEVSPGSTLKVARGAVARVVPPETDSDTTPETQTPPETPAGEPGDDGQ